MSPSPLDENAPNQAESNLASLMHVQLPVSIRFGETEMTLGEVLKLGVGSIIELNASVDDPVELIVNGRKFARGTVVTVDGSYGIQIAEINKSRRAGDTFYTGPAGPAQSGPGAKEDA